MEHPGEIRGTCVTLDAPEWEPLLNVVDEAVAEWFMCMFAVATCDGRRLVAYKHIVTRRYLHLDGDGHAFYYVPEDRYRPIELWRLLELALAPWWEGPIRDDEAEGVAAARKAVARARETAG